MRTAVLAAIAAALLSLTPGAAPAQEEPEAVYAKFHRALMAGDLATLTRYGTPAGGAELAAMPAEQRKAILDMMKKLLPRSYSIAGREISPDGGRAILRATGTGPSLFGGGQETQYGSIRLLKMGGEWKVDESSWNNQPPPGWRASAPPAAAAAAPRPATAAAPAAAAKAAPAARAAARKPQPERPLGVAKPACVYKPVMSNEDIENCR